MKKGFTLIELLAVIVILAIIALIAAPLVLKYIEKSRKESKVDSTYSFVRNLENEIANYAIKNNGKKYTSDKENINELGLDITVKGENPTDGKVCLSSLGQVEKGIFQYGKYYVSYDGKKGSISDKDTYDNFSCTNSGGDNGENNRVEVPDAEGKTMQMVYQQDFPVFTINNVKKSDLLNGGSTSELGDSFTATIKFVDGSTEEITFSKSNFTHSNGEVVLRYDANGLQYFSSILGITLFVDTYASNYSGFEYNTEYCSIYVDGIYGSYEFDIEYITILNTTITFETTYLNKYTVSNGFCVDLKNVSQVIFNFKDGDQEIIDMHNYYNAIYYGSNSGFLDGSLVSVNVINAEDAILFNVDNKKSFTGYAKQGKPLKSITINETIDGNPTMTTYDIVIE